MGEKKPWWVRQIEILFQALWITGTALAVVQSWEKFHSIKFSAFAGLMQWFYVAFPGVYESLMK